MKIDMTKIALFTTTAILTVSIFTFTACLKPAASTTTTQTSTSSLTSTTAGSSTTSSLTSTQTTSTSTTSSTTTSTSTKTTSTTSTTTPVNSTTPATLFLNILQPADETIVDVNSVLIKGQTIPDAVISINADLVDVDSNGYFSLKVTLDEGPNVFDIIATDEDGNEVSTEIVVFFSP